MNEDVPLKPNARILITRNLFAAMYGGVYKRGGPVDDLR